MSLDRPGLRAALRAAYPWLDDPEVGPRTVDAGECDRCGHEARLVATCGPVEWRALGRRCATQVGPDAWCDGHADDGRRALRRLEELPDEADEVARLWWVATGEVQLDPLSTPEANPAVRTAGSEGSPGRGSTSPGRPT